MMQNRQRSLEAIRARATAPPRAPSTLQRTLTRMRAVPSSLFRGPRAVIHAFAVLEVDILWVVIALALAAFGSFGAFIVTSTFPPAVQWLLTSFATSAGAVILLVLATRRGMGR